MSSLATRINHTSRTTPSCPVCSYITLIHIHVWGMDQVPGYLDVSDALFLVNVTPALAICCPLQAAFLIG